MRAPVGAFKHDKALVGAFSVIVKLLNIFAKVRLKLYNPPCPPVTPRWGNVQLTNFLFTCLIVSSLFDNSKNFQKLFQSCIFIPPNNCRFAKQWRYLIWTTRSTLFDLWIYLPSIHKLWCLDINVSKPSPKVRRYLLHAPPVLGHVAISVAAPHIYIYEDILQTTMLLTDDV